MRYLIWLLCLILLMIPGTVLLADGLESTWQQALTLYSQGKYAEALAQFELVAKTTDHWRIHFNIGNCLLKLERNTEAKIAYIKVWRVNPGLPSLRKNLAVVNARLGVGDEVLTEMIWQKTLNRLSQYLSPGMSGALLILVTLLLNVSIFFWIRPYRKRLARYGVALSLVLALIFGSHLLYTKAMYEQHDLAVVILENSSLFSGPGQEHTALFSVPVGLTLRIEDRGNGWWRVTAGAEIAGWIKSDRLKEI